jgi:thiamine-phosphate pyrophosphorylase
MESAEIGFDYLSFGAFFESKTKISRGKPDISIINWASEILNLPVVAIGGINANNCRIFAKNNIDLIAVISFVWEHSSGVKKE